MPIWTFDLPDDAQPNLILDLSSRGLGARSLSRLMSLWNRFWMSLLTAPW